MSRRRSPFTPEVAALFYLDFAFVTLLATGLVLTRGLESTAPVWATILTSPWSSLSLSIAQTLRPTLTGWPWALGLFACGALVNALIILATLRSLVRRPVALV